MRKRLICLLLALFILVGLLPTNAIALEVTEAPTAGGTPVGKVQVVVENTTASPAPGGGYGTWESGAEQWSGERIHKTVGLYADSTMMSCIAEALEGHSVTGVESGYISAIDGLKADGSAGWMGTLNGWFTALGFTAYTHVNGQLRDGDVIRLSYTCTGGSDMDLYAVWTRLRMVSFPNMPQGARIVVKQGETELLVSETENVWLLHDGSYSFTAELFGYLTKENVAFTVSGADLSLQDSLTRAPSYAVSFTGVPEGAVLTVSHEVGSVQTPTANENGTIAYLLIPGTYSYTVKRDDYRTVHGTVTVEAAAQSVPVSMVAITLWDGTVATGFAGGNGTQDAPMRSNPATSWHT